MFAYRLSFPFYNHQRKTLYPFYNRFHFCSNYRRKTNQSLTMTIYMNRLFGKSNSSSLLSNGKVIRSQVTRFKDDIFLIDTGMGTPKLTMPDELRPIPANRDVTRFENKVGFMEATTGESLVKTQILERLFMDLVAGESAMKERATARFNDLVGGATEAVAGEPAILLPRRFTQNQAWVELRKAWQANRKVKGFLMEKTRGGYSVAVGGYIAFLPNRPLFERRKLGSDHYIIESINSKRKKITLF